ncbi:methionyl-tRNA formyltransferase [Cytobacillus purgationiresistens]|uniref:Methionyl-tRNA formyltransferase n=1 Tax=Cytobacillus purgationiresistens TaxID=863449 RepID=A0ABU0AKM3_9BACI|nr:formyltransferase family protein [Cytobacillus purgationiresistens]MDQ0270933.1 methionyl-tRNA formyltransferase [Cytobacillus purgationiresistens]
MNNTKQSLKIVLLGRKHWSAKALEYLIDRGHEVVAVVGRQVNDELDSSKGSLVETATQLGILTPTSEELYSWFDDSMNSPIAIDEVDLVISYLFWQKVKEPLLSAPRLGAINFHPAPLPEYQGLGGYNAAILNGCTEYGVTAHLMDEGIDSGDIIKLNRFNIDEDLETALSLELKSQIHMLDLFKETVELIEMNQHRENLIKNIKSNGIYIDREMFESMKITDENDSSEEISRRIRAFWYPPYEGAKVKVGEQYYTLTDQKILSDLSKLIHS